MVVASEKAVEQSKSASADPVIMPGLHGCVWQMGLGSAVLDKDLLLVAAVDTGVQRPANAAPSRPASAPPSQHSPPAKYQATHQTGEFIVMPWPHFDHLCTTFTMLLQQLPKQQWALPVEDC